MSDISTSSDVCISSDIWKIQSKQTMNSHLLLESNPEKENFIANVLWLHQGPICPILRPNVLVGQNIPAPLCLNITHHHYVWISQITTPFQEPECVRATKGKNETHSTPHCTVHLVSVFSKRLLFLNTIEGGCTLMTALLLHSPSLHWSPTCTALVSHVQCTVHSDAKQCTVKWNTLCVATRCKVPYSVMAHSAQWNTSHSVRHTVQSEICTTLCDGRPFSGWCY